MFMRLTDRAMGTSDDGGFLVLHPERALWFAVQVVPQHEHKVSMRLRYKGEKEFLPTVTTRRQWSDRNKLSVQVLFPGYIFCHVKHSSFGAILSTPGVYRIVSFGGRAHPISDEEIYCLQRAVESGRDLCSVPYFALGQKVRVTEGPLSGVTGIVARLKNRDRLIISVDLLMRSIAVEIAMSDLAVYDGSEKRLSDSNLRSVAP